MSPWSRPLLIVDHDASSRDRYRALLEHAGYRVETAATAAALTRVAAGAIELVIVSSPRLGAQELNFCRQLRAQQGTIYLPIIVLAPHAGPEARAEGLLTCADDFVTLPL